MNHEHCTSEFTKYTKIKKISFLTTEQNTTDLFTRVDNNFINNKDLNIISSPADISCNFTFAYIKGSESIVFLSE